ncbi:MAG: hypothetical protein H7333_02485 [Bdellovibrionales bacterium]|nr:hypothetical protein [Oligoflexia bacterium]
MKQLKILFIGLIASGLVTACGNTNYQPDQLTSPAGAAVYGVSSDAYLPASQRCSSSPNVSANDSSFNNEYRACNTGTTIGSVALYPSDSQSKTVCVFPVRMTPNGQASAIISSMNNPLATRYVYQCGNIQGSGGVISMRGLSFNAMYVVEATQAKVAMLAACINSGDVGTCAAANNLTVSFGQL